MRILKNAMAWFRNAKKALPLCYALLLLFWLVRGGVLFVYDRAQPVLMLPIEAEQQEGLAEEGGWLVSTNYDPQLVYETVNTPVRRVLLVCEFEDVPGEIDAYYTRTGQAGFSARQRVWGRPVAEGYLFELPAGEVQDLRIDPGNLIHNRMHLYEVQFNPAQPFWAYILPSLRGLLAFALLPALAYCVIYTIIEAIPAKHLKDTQKSEEATDA